MPVTFKVNIEKLSESLRNKLDSLPSLFGEAMHGAALSILIPAIKMQLLRNEAYFTGDLYNKITAELDYEGKSPVILIRADVRDRVLNTTYDVLVEKGAPPHEANLQRLIAWVMEKDRLPEKIARPIAVSGWRTIREVGTEPQGYAEYSYELNKKRFLLSIHGKLRYMLSRL